MKKLLFINFALLIMLSGCTTLLSVSTTEIHPGNTNIIKASDSGYGILHLFTPEINIQPKLREQCQNSIINGVQTTLTLREFLVFQVYEVKATAYCK